MANTPLRKVRAGEKLRTSLTASGWNAFIDATNYVRAQQQQQRGGSQAMTLPAGQVWVRNDSGGNRDRFAVLGVGGVVVSPGDNANAFAEMPRVTGVVPTADHVGGRFVVLVEPVASEKIGRAFAGGVCICKVNVSDADHEFADAASGTTAALVSAETGPVQLLWKESGTGDGKWAIGRFGGGAAAPGVKWGKLVSAWTPGSETVSLQPVADATGTALDPVPATVAVRVIMPIGQAPAYLLGDVDDLFAYEDLGGVYLLKSPQTTPIPAAAYEVMQAVAGGEWAADYLRGSDIP